MLDGNMIDYMISKLDSVAIPGNEYRNAMHPCLQALEKIKTGEYELVKREEESPEEKGEDQ